MNNNLTPKKNPKLVNVHIPPKNPKIEKKLKNREIFQTFTWITLTVLCQK